MDRHVRVPSELRIDGNEVVIALELQRVARQVDERDPVRSELAGFGQEVAKGAADGVAAEIPCARHVEAGGGQCLRHEPRVVGRRRVFAPSVGAVTDDQRDARSRRLRLHRRNGYAEGDEERCQRQRLVAKSRHRRFPILGIIHGRHLNCA